MAPKVCVPADFGRHHIGAPSHGNLTFNLGGGVQIKANSIILSLNSPVIADLLTDLQLMSLEAEDFSREAVDCFIEATYTGELEAVNVGNFRDVTKMSHVFQVDWLVARCEKYFVSYLNKLDSESSYSNMLFAVEESVHLLKYRNKRDFLNLVVNRMGFVSVLKRATFIKEYLSDFANSSKYKIDACIAIIRSDIHVLIEMLILHLEKQGTISLDDNTRYLLKNVDLATCHDQTPDLHTKLYSVLANLQCVCKEDFQLLLAIAKQVTSRSHAKRECILHSSIFFSASVFSYLKCFDQSVKLDNAIKNLAVNKDTQNLYSLIDGVLYRLYQGNEPVPKLKQLLQNITNEKREREWSELDFDYVDNLYSDEKTSGFVTALKTCNRLVSKNVTSAKITIFDYVTPDDFVEAVFLQNNSFTIEVPYPKYADRQYIVTTTAMKGGDPDTFSLKYGLLDSDQGFLQDLPKLHFAIEMVEVEGKSSSRVLPITWCGKPTCDKTKTYWNWGYIKFHSWQFKKLDMICGSEGPVELKNFVSVVEGFKCRLVAFVIS